MSIKKELEGQSGILKMVRNQYMPSTKDMAELAYARYLKKRGSELTKEFIYENTDDVLKELFQAETDIFNEKQQKIISSVIPYYYNEIYKKNDKRFPNTSKSMDMLADLYVKVQSNACSQEDFIARINETIGPMLDIASFSQRQSAKSRVGNTLQNHLERMFEICSIPNEVQQCQEEGETIMDFVIPNLEACTTMPDHVINIECQTTLKDRFRLTTGKTTDARVNRYLATMTGLGIVTSGDKKDLTIGKLKEIIVKNNVTLIVHKDVKNQSITKIDNALKKLRKKANKEVEINELQQLRRLCQNKLISYTELFNRDIKSLQTYLEYNKNC